MLYQTFAHQLNRAKNMLDGLSANVERMAKRGITAEFLTKMADLHDRASQLESRRNALKASTQAATTEQEQIMAELNTLCSEARKLIRIEMPEDSWPAFGFRAGQFSSKKSNQTTEPSETAAS